MFKKNEMFKTAILAALVLFSTVAVFAIVVMVPPPAVGHAAQLIYRLT